MAQHLTQDQTDAIMALLVQGRRLRDVARIVGVTYSQVRRVNVQRDGYIRDPRGRKPKTAG